MSTNGEKATNGSAKVSTSFDKEKAVEVTKKFEALYIDRDYDAMLELMSDDVKAALPFRYDEIKRDTCECEIKIGKSYPPY